MSYDVVCELLPEQIKTQVEGDHESMLKDCSRNVDTLRVKVTPTTATSSWAVPARDSSLFGEGSKAEHHPESIEK